MRLFYQANSIWTAVRSELSWPHYRILLQVGNPQAPDWYMQESINHRSWSSRALERQVDKLYYERLLMSKDKDPVIQEAENYIKPL